LQPHSIPDNIRMFAGSYPLSLRQNLKKFRLEA
jgi:hypothetical protein